MSQATTSDNSNRTRRHIFIKDANYAKVAGEATIKKVDNGRIIDEALEQYFDKKQQNN